MHALAPVLVVSVLALWCLARLDLVAEEPLWFLVPVFVLVSLTSWATGRAYRAAPSPSVFHLRVGVQVTVASAVTYLSGWGPALVLTYVFIAHDNLTVSGGRHWRAILVWVAAGLAAGQAAIMAGVAPSFIHTPGEYGLAALTALGTLWFVGLLGVNREHLAELERSLRRSEERLSTTLETANDAYIEIDHKGIVQSWNSRAEAIFGWSREEAVGRGGEEIILPEDQRNPETQKRNREELARRGKERVVQRHYEFNALHRDGHVFPAELAFWQTRDAEGIRFHGFVHDISERRAAETALRNSQQDFALLFARHPHPMWVWDIETLGFVEVNEAAVTHYGYRRDEFLSMTIDEIRPPEDTDLLAEHLSVAPEGVGGRGCGSSRGRAPGDTGPRRGGSWMSKVPPTAWSSEVAIASWSWPRTSRNGNGSRVSCVIRPSMIRLPGCRTDRSSSSAPTP